MRFHKQYPAIFTCQKSKIETLDKVLNMSKVSNKTPEGHRRRSGFFNVNFEHIPHLFLVLLMLNWNK